MQPSRKQKFAYGALFIILIGFLIFAVLSSRDSKTTPSSGTTRIRESAADNQPSTAGSEPSTPSESTPAPSSSAPSNTATASGQQLVNSGPGETVTLFVATVLAGTAVAHVHQRRTVLK